MLLTLGSPMTVKSSGQVRIIMFYDLSCLVLSPFASVSNGNKSINQHESWLGFFWDHPELSVSIFIVKVVQGREVKERSNWKLWVWVVWWMFLDEVFGQNTKKLLNTFERSKSDKNWEYGTYRNLRELRVWPFSTFNTSKPDHFKNCTSNFVYVGTIQCSFTFIPFFWQNWKIRIF